MSAADLDLRNRAGLGVRPGESNPAEMLCLVLLLLTVAGLMGALALTWWLV